MKEIMMLALESCLHTWPEAILFDWDDTLVDTWLAYYEAFNQTLIALGRTPYTLEEFYQQPYTSVRDHLVSIFYEKAPEVEMFFYKILSEIHLKIIRPVPGAEKLIKFLRKNNVYMGIVSNKSGDILRKEVNHLGWSSYFAQVVGANDTPEEKPSRLPLLKALEPSNILPSKHVWFIGDSIADVLCARNAACTPIVVGRNAASMEKVLGNTKEIGIVYGESCLKMFQFLIYL